jgi:hypothetical protein
MASMKIAPVLWPLLALLLVAGAKKQPAMSVRFYTEANKRDGAVFAIPVTLQFPPRQAYIEKIPAISDREIDAIYPFPASDGTMGCAFQLDEHGRIGLDTLSVERRGSSIVAVVNGRQVIDMVIDQRVADGIITIPRGLAPMEIAWLQKKFRTMAARKSP